MNQARLEKEYKKLVPHTTPINVVRRLHFLFTDLALKEENLNIKIEEFAAYATQRFLEEKNYASALRLSVEFEPTSHKKHTEIAGEHVHHLLNDVQELLINRLPASRSGLEKEILYNELGDKISDLEHYHTTCFTEGDYLYQGKNYDLFGKLSVIKIEADFQNWYENECLPEIEDAYQRTKTSQELLQQVESNLTDHLKIKRNPKNPLFSDDFHMYNKNNKDAFDDIY